MSTIAEKLSTLKSIKSDIQSAIIEKGGSASDSFASYAQAIRDLPSGGGDDSWQSLIENLYLPSWNDLHASELSNFSSLIKTIYAPSVLLVGGTFSFPNLTSISVPLCEDFYGDFTECSNLVMHNENIPNVATLFTSLNIWGDSIFSLSKLIYMYQSPFTSDQTNVTAAYLPNLSECVSFLSRFTNLRSLTMGYRIVEHYFTASLYTPFHSTLEYLEMPSITANYFSDSDCFTYYTNLKALSIPTVATTYSHMWGLNTSIFQSITMGVNYLGSSTANPFSVFSSTLKYISFSRCRSTSTDCFKGFKSLQEAYLPNCTIAGGGLFAQCYNLRIVDLEQCYRMDGWVFEMCYSLSSVNLPNCTQISAEEFISCHNLTKISMPNLQTVNGYSNFAYCSKLSEVYMPLISELTDRNFTYCTNLQKVTLSKRCALNSSVFLGCPSIDVDTLPRELVILTSTAFNADVMEKISDEHKIFAINKNQYSYISGWYGFVSGIASAFGTAYVSLPNAWFLGWACFSSCSALRSVSIPKAIRIPYQGFYQCSKLTSLYCPNVETILSFGCDGCTYLPSISLPKCKNINSIAFRNCTSLSYISIPQCSYIGDYAFQGCTALLSIDMPQGDWIGGYAFQGCTALSTVNLPLVSIIYSCGFHTCTALTSISAPNLRTISTYAFCGCTALTSVEFPKCSIVNSYAFINCTSLERVSFPSSVSLSASAFQSCTKLSYVYAPYCTRLRAHTFQGCTALATVDLRSVSDLIDIFSTTFSGCTAIKSIYLPSSLLSSYKTQYYWSSLSSYMIGV